MNAMVREISMENNSRVPVKKRRYERDCGDTQRTFISKTSRLNIVVRTSLGDAFYDLVYASILYTDKKVKDIFQSPRKT